METASVSFPVALIAGAISFITPCVLPLVPVYLSILSGTSFDKLTGKGGTLSKDEQRSIQARVIANAFAFIIGFSLIFIIAGVAAGSVGTALTNAKGQVGAIITNVLLVVFGPLLIIMGLNQSGVYKPAFLNTEKRFSLQKGKFGVVSSGLIGAAFAFGWAPCIGPILAIILALAAGSGSKVQGALLLATYSLGLAIPFFLSALSVNGLIAFSQKMRRHFNMLELIIGIVLILFGLFLGLTGIDGFRLNTNGLDIIRQKLPGLDEFVIDLEERLQGGDSDEIEPLEMDNGDVVMFERSDDDEVDVTGESVEVDDSELEPVVEIDGGTELTPGDGT